MVDKIKQQESLFINELAKNQTIYLADVLESIHTLASKKQKFTYAELYDQYKKETNEEIDEKSKNQIRELLLKCNGYVSYICAYPRQYNNDKINTILENNK